MTHCTGQVALLGNGLPRHSIRCIDHGKSCIKPERCRHGHTQESGAISDRATDHLERTTDGGCYHTTSRHALTAIGQQIEKTGAQ